MSLVCPQKKDCPCKLLAPVQLHKRLHSEHFHPGFGSSQYLASTQRAMLRKFFLGLAILIL